MHQQDIPPEGNDPGVDTRAPQLDPAHAFQLIALDPRARAAWKAHQAQGDPVLREQQEELAAERRAHLEQLLRSKQQR